MTDIDTTPASISSSTTRRVQLRAYGGPDVLHVTSGEIAATPGPGEVRVRVLASSLTLSDSIVRRGMNPYTSHLQPPFTLGYDFVGAVESVADDPSGTDLRVGDLVVDLTRWGANADHVTRPAASLTRIDADIDPIVLEPLVMTGVTALQALDAADVGAGSVVLVHGATGGVGTLMTELAVLRGAAVLATGSPSKHQVLRDRGATPLDGRAADLPRTVRRLAPNGVDVVLDGVGGTSRRAVAATLRPGGTMVGFGFAGPASAVTVLTDEARDRTAQVLADGHATLDEVRRSGGRAVEYEVGASRERHRHAYDRDINALAAMVTAGRLRPVVRAVPLREVARAHADIDAGAVTGRLVLDHTAS